MEIKRLHKKETRFLVLICGLGAVLALSAMFLFYFIWGNKTGFFEKNLINNNYPQLYKFIENPDFNEGIFKAYMDYNFGNKIEVLEKVKSGEYIYIKVRGVQGVRNISLVNRNGKYRWEFSDYVYNWQIKVPEKAVVYVENNEVQNKEGIVQIEKIPFGVYNLKVVMRNCEPYTTRIMAGQKAEIKLEPSKEIVNKCKDYLWEYFKFKEGIINGGKPGEISCVDKGSGIYSEIIDEASLYADDNFKVTKKLMEYKIEKAYFNDEGNIILDVSEKWDVEINNQGEVDKKTENNKNKYVFKTDNDIKLIQIKTNK
ncbi:hypothetical protein [Fonticella tunisiensis]|uniref:Uncharacterized protein n=1 Tax=Fonticella tunisiensis TaxID=1096341 RepID=A0A4R7KQY8_9CLOT|nr:hypothetical protein [Fonticella tunisiensis]TDT61094.1 hypothetical protein EDD71_109109 [Fonticella tunisiensis]